MAIAATEIACSTPARVTLLHPLGRGRADELLRGGIWSSWKVRRVGTGRTVYLPVVTGLPTSGTGPESRWPSTAGPGPAAHRRTSGRLARRRAGNVAAPRRVGGSPRDDRDRDLRLNVTAAARQPRNVRKESDGAVGQPASAVEAAGTYRDSSRRAGHDPVV